MWGDVGGWWVKKIFAKNRVHWAPVYTVYSYIILSIILTGGHVDVWTNGHGSRMYLFVTDVRRTAGLHYYLLSSMCFRF